MIKITDKILQLKKTNGTFIVFCEYDSEDVFSDFLEFIHNKLGANVGTENQYPYSKSAAIIFPFGVATAICQGGIGCALRIDPGEERVVKDIVERCLVIK
ncbi:hypothetical protein [Shewanella frigidimarina]|jgi:hypothetical protein|uniref:hypothetical protein n=1 Tax=Shewanella frigidimarina TaxID=56812 RepID=UPI000F4E9C3E|nr:hypothetical protein [Shewanella frigidimarina]RPA27281.1 hypothetical protein EGC78_18245 [Shewanella frigidimarina]|tara:strand:+ start:969 stop:1268 length:300 start_codon:yes stop_codon:yes gene_type:complete